MALPRAWGLTEDDRNINRAKRDSKSWAKGYRQPSTIGCGRWLPILAQFCIHAIWQEQVSVVKEDQEYCRYNSLQLWGLDVWLLLLISAPKVWWLDSTSDLLDNSAEHRQVLNAAPWKGSCMTGTVLDVVLALECCVLMGSGFCLCELSYICVVPEEMNSSYNSSYNLMISPTIRSCGSQSSVCKRKIGNEIMEWELLETEPYAKVWLVNETLGILSVVSN